jgi:hypothetical protein
MISDQLELRGQKIPGLPAYGDPNWLSILPDAFLHTDSALGRIP